MAKRVSERATRGGEHGGVGTPHARGASGIVLGVGVDEASSISFRLRARRLVGSVTRRRGGPLAHQPSGRGPGCGGASEREIGSPNPVGGGFASGMRSGRPNSLRGKCVKKMLFQKNNRRRGVSTHAVPLASARQHPETKKRKTRPAIRRSARWWRYGGGPCKLPSCAMHVLPNTTAARWQLAAHGT